MHWNVPLDSLSASGTFAYSWTAGLRTEVCHVLLPLHMLKLIKQRQGSSNHSTTVQYKRKCNMNLVACAWPKSSEKVRGNF